jgi:hypothetical protein
MGTVQMVEMGQVSTEAPHQKQGANTSPITHKEALPRYHAGTRMLENVFAEGPHEGAIDQAKHLHAVVLGVGGIRGLPSHLRSAAIDRVLASMRTPPAGGEDSGPEG